MGCFGEIKSAGFGCFNSYPLGECHSSGNEDQQMPLEFYLLRLLRQVEND